MSRTAGRFGAPLLLAPSFVHKGAVAIVGCAAVAVVRLHWPRRSPGKRPLPKVMLAFGAREALSGVDGPSNYRQPREASKRANAV